MEAFDMELLNRLAKSYNTLNKQSKTVLLNEYCRLTKINRKTAIKRFERYRVGQGLLMYRLPPIP